MPIGDFHHFKHCGCPAHYWCTHPAPQPAGQIWTSTTFLEKLNDGYVGKHRKPGT